MKVARICGLITALLFYFSGVGWAQESSSPAPARAVTNVMIHTADGETVESGAIVWRDGVIESVGNDIDIPFDAYVIDGGDSLHVYPGFIDGLALWGSPDRPDDIETPDRPGEPDYARAGIQPQRMPHNLITNDNSFEKAQKLGFTTAALGLKGEMLPGQIDIFFINGAETEEYLYRPGIGILAQLEGARGAAYPSTRMGVMAQYRQLWYNAKALMTHKRYYEDASTGYAVPDQNEVFAALFPVLNNEQPLFFVADSKEFIQRMLWLQDELGFNAVLVSGKAAYEKSDILINENIPVLAAIDLPEEPEWRTVQDEEQEGPDFEEMEITEEERIFRQRQLEAYRADIENVKSLIETGVKVGYVSNGMDLDEFRDHLIALHEEAGMPPRQILQMLTQNTADILGVGARTGDLEEGNIANFTLFTMPFLEEDTQVRYSVSAGNLTEFDIEPKSEESEEEEEE